MGFHSPSRKHARHQLQRNVIEAIDPLWLGAGFTARMTLDRPVRLNCFVKRVEPGLGMGVSVAVSESESQKVFEDLLSALSNTGS